MTCYLQSPENYFGMNGVESVYDFLVHPEGPKDLQGLDLHGGHILYPHVPSLDLAAQATTWQMTVWR